MSNLYVNQMEYNFLVNLIEDAMLTCGEIDADGYDCSESLLRKLGYPEVYRNEIQSRLEKQDFRYKERCKVPSHSDFDKLQSVLNDLEKWGDESLMGYHGKDMANVYLKLKIDEIRKAERIKTLIENNVYEFRCENCGIFVKTLSLHCPNCHKEGYLCGSFKDEDLKKWLEDHV